MDALVYSDVMHCEFTEYAKPESQDGQTLIDVSLCGICGSDMHAWHGHDSRRVPPLVLGHEVVGRAVDGPLAGQLVAVNPLLNCGDCTACQSGATHLSRNGCFTVRLDEGHSQSHIGLCDKERGLYIAMDFLLPRISPNISVDLRDLSKDLLGAYLAYLEDIQHMDESWHIFPGHDWPFTKGASRAKDLIRHHHERLDALCAVAADGPITVDSGMGTLFGKSFEAHELYFASGEARAHLTHLVATGRMQLQQDALGQAPDYFALSQP